MSLIHPSTSSTFAFLCREEKTDEETISDLVELVKSLVERERTTMGFWDAFHRYNTEGIDYPVFLAYCREKCNQGGPQDPLGQVLALMDSEMGATGSAWDVFQVAIDRMSLLAYPLNFVLNHYISRGIQKSRLWARKFYQAFI